MLKRSNRLYRTLSHCPLAVTRIGVCCGSLLCRPAVGQQGQTGFNFLFFCFFFLFLVFSDHFKSTVRLSNILMKGVNTCDFCVAEGQCVNFEFK